ncbi:BCLAF1 and THRAP3 family member 3 isoform X1 [Kryptolebias marmoratus]|uniref:BCLAF1 and THRAP3 family member 3-like n=1 Tax=Kryptolebias marmoratus TaxID=37003 RepID=A0A3Q3AGV2_KRYMA|nr:BCLAF1 and THRAP3 family member 3 isoform X1 [Kryptolebias marmoratus]XP_037829071.1 BCLAF1 and THRAP3 family member 3 isoform X1 [Kryptolebias marmoratus]
MSRPRSRSPHYRRFPWEEPDFDPRKVLEEHDESPRDQSQRFRRGPEEPRDSFRDDMSSGGQRIPSLFPDDPHFRRQRHSDHDFYHGSLSPHRDGYESWSPTPQDNGGFDEDRRRGGFREDFQSFENREAFPWRDRLSPTQREAGVSWRRPERGRGRGRGQGRFEDFSSSVRSGDLRAEDMERGRRNTQGPFKGRQRENPHQDRGPVVKRPRGEMDDVKHFGYGHEEDFGNRGFSADRPRGGFGGRSWENLPGKDLLVVEHDHGIAGGRNAPQFNEFEDRRHFERDFDRRRSPRLMGSSQERFRSPGGRLDNREERHFQDNSRDSNYRETRRSPNTMRYGNQDGPTGSRGRWRSNQGQGGGFEPPRNRQRYQNLPHDEQRTNYQPFRENFKDLSEKEPNWADEDRRPEWEDNRARSSERNLRRNDLGPNMSGQSRWEDQSNENVTVITEETLTIKVDMSQPANQISPLCYSSDRQLSFDLVNVGRQRLDFLPMLEHSGTYRETEMHTGAFTQEIITLVHYVKDQYFGGDGVTLNQRFSAPQRGGEEELTLSQRFSSSRGFSLNSDSLLDDEDEEPLFSRLDSLQNKQPSRGPGDLRHDLERRRQEKLEAVKVTIPGSGSSQRSHGAVSEPDLMAPEHEGFWTGEQNRRRDGNMGPRRGASNRQNPGPQRWNHRYGHQRQNSHPAGPGW